MASVNRAIILGNLTRDPEFRTFASGDGVANMSIATNEKWKDKQTGELKESTEFHRVVCLGRLAEIADQYLRKGSQVYIEGSIHTRKWTDSNGVEKYSTEIKAQSLQMLGSPAGSRDDGGRQERGRDDRGGYDDRGRNDRNSGRDDRRDPPARQQRPDDRRQAPREQQRQAAPQRQASSAGSGFDDIDSDVPW